MNRASLDQFLAARLDDPAIQLLARTTAAVRTDADFVHRAGDVAGGAFLAEERPASLSDDALEQVLSRIGHQDVLDRGAAAADPRHPEIASLPSPVREVALRVLERRGWAIGGPGIKRLPLLAGHGTQAELMRVEPGCAAARHDHDDLEVTLVLRGGYDDGIARFEAGDLSLAEPGFSHLPRALPGEVCYVLAVTYGPPRFFGFFRFLQKMLGFPWPPKA